LDVAIANQSTNTVSILMGNGDGTFRESTTYRVGLSPDSIALGDFDRDGNLDLVTANYLSAGVSVLLGNGNGTFGSALNYNGGDRPNFVAVGDFSGSGFPDLAVSASFGPGQVAVFRNLADWQAGQAPSRTPHPHPGTTTAAVQAGTLWS